MTTRLSACLPAHMYTCHKQIRKYHLYRKHGVETSKMISKTSKIFDFVPFSGESLTIIQNQESATGQTFYTTDRPDKEATQTEHGFTLNKKQKSTPCLQTKHFHTRRKQVHRFRRCAHGRQEPEVAKSPEQPANLKHKTVST